LRGCRPGQQIRFYADEKENGGTKGVVKKYVHRRDDDEVLD
jgi:hypothetical protein